MRSYKSHSKQINDENIRVRNKSVSNPKSESYSRREVLGDLTQANENIIMSRKKMALDIGKTQPSSKLQVYKQHQLLNQHKKSRLDSVLTAIPRHNITSDDTDENDEFNEDEVEKENNPPASLSLHEHSDGILVKSGYLPQNKLSNKTDDEYIEDYEDDLEKPDDVDITEQRQSFDESHNKPMEPIWNKEIFNELQYVMKKFSRSTLDENDEDTYDVTMVAEYAPEIFNYMHELEHKLLPDSNYMENQDELKWEMRSVLIDWVVQVHSRFNLLPETLFLTVNYIDRFLSKRKVSLSRFQLVGAVALFIAAKYEEINCPTVQEVAYMADNAYGIDDFLKAERFMIDVLEFDMGWPGPMSFLRRTSKADDYDYETRTLAKYFLEITIMDSKFIASQPSWLAAGAHYLARRLLNKGSWTEAHVFYSGYTEAQLSPLAEVLMENCRNAETNHRAIFEKYQERRYRRSSTFVQEYLHSIE